MAENSLVQKPETDLTEKDMERIKEFASEGMPGLAKLQESDFHRMTEMYMNGSTYTQIYTAMRCSRPLVLYISHTYGWYAARQEYLNELQGRIKTRVIDSKLASQDFLLLLVQTYQKKLTKKMQAYLATDDPSHTNDINLKEIDKLIKAIETIQSLSGDGKKPGSKTPVVGLNLGDGVTVERSGENKVTITPTIDKQLGSMLKKFADNRRAEESQKSSDISRKQTKKEEPKDEN
jgi:hypothetical protein